MINTFACLPVQSTTQFSLLIASPKIIMIDRDSHYIISHNGNVSFECNADGIPPPSVMWEKLNPLTSVRYSVGVSILN